jgi:hypothetical protein
MARLLRFIIAAVTSAAVILLLTFGTYALHLWVGGQLSVRDFILRSFVLLPIILGFVAALWPSPNLNRSPLAAGATGAAVGLVYGYMAPRVLYGVNLWRIFGHLPRLVSIEWGIDVAALMCAAVAGTCAMLLSMTTRSRVVVAAVLILVLCAVLLPGPAVDHINHNQELTVAVVIPYSAGMVPKANAIADVYSTPLDVGTVTERVLALLRNQGIAGQYRVSDLYRDGHGKQILAVVVINSPIVSEVQLQQPRGGDVIYFQQPDGWRKIPPQRPTLNRFLTIEPPITQDAIAELRINRAGGFSTGIEIWKTSN